MAFSFFRLIFIAAVSCITAITSSSRPYPGNATDVDAVWDNSQPSGRVLATTKKYTIPVYVFHTYSPADAPSALTKSEIRRKYFSFLSHSFRDTPFLFTLKSIRIVESLAFSHCIMGQPSEFKMKKKLRVPGKTSLNIFICNTGGAGSAAKSWGSVPVMSDSDYDGVVLTNYRLLPVDDPLRWSYISNIAHEVGHWLGLLHTFEGGCLSEPTRFIDGSMIIGDAVLDTPAHSGPTNLQPGKETCWLLDPPLNTCPDNVAGVDAGDDPVGNTMNYLYSKCRRNATFTAGQVERMVVQHETFRLDRICRQQNIACRLDSQCCAGLRCLPDDVTGKSCQ
ncbi:hypothetical protein MPSEU_000016900 [Mayamaea pseudoterrestris]|nr:hypothetical protein MPSEU_000016900 [Mayamaea pseudoterrestris]